MWDFEKQTSFKRKNIEKLAYNYWEQGGCRDGHDACHWLRAQEVIEQRERRKLTVSKKRIIVKWIAILFLLPVFYSLIKSLFYADFTNVEFLIFAAIGIIGFAWLCLYCLHKGTNCEEEEGKLIASPRHVWGAVIAIVGTIIVFCPNIDSVNQWYRGLNVILSWK
jgi:hypothetical protein